jgi:hypothetical protein
MRRLGIAWVVVLLAVVFISGAERLSGRAMPFVIMFYGGALPKPVFIVQRSASEAGAYLDFWCGRSGHVTQEQLSERPYFNIAMFWGITLPDASKTDEFLATLKADQAHQHGRLYVAKDQTGAAVVTTDYFKMGPAPDGKGALPMPRPIPRDLSEFKYGAWMTDADFKIAESIGVRAR